MKNNTHRWKSFNTILVFVVFLGICISSWSVLHGDINFNTDIARDFLLLEDVVDNHNLSLIGPKAGGIAGVFHGPLWMYMHVPAYFIGHGDPIIIGWFWILLVSITSGILYFVCDKLFGKTQGLVAAALFATYSFDIGRTLFNPFGAVIVAPLFSYTLLRYLRSQKMRYLLYTYFLIGILIQFQIAFGGPILMLTILLTSLFIAKHKEYKHLTAYLALLPPLASYFLFEIRNNFLQLRSIISFLTSHETAPLSLLSKLSDRIMGILFLHNYFIKGQIYWLTGVLFLCCLVILLRKNKAGKLLHKDVYSLLAYLYGGYWILSLFFGGIVWSYYVWPFIPLLIIHFSSMMDTMNNKVWMSIVSIIIVWQLFLGYNDIIALSKFSGKEASSWKASKDMSELVFNSNDEDFGYYIFTPELFGYTPRYAMDFSQKAHIHTAYPFQKKKITYLIMIPPNNNGTTQDMSWWKTKEVGIDKKPVKIIHMSDYIIEKYELSEKEISIPSNPNLIQGIYFR